MLVIVFLQDAKCFTVVPEGFVYSLDEKSLKNRGVNKNQNRLIYFSRELFKKMEENEEYEQNCKPNFHRPISIKYPLPDNLEDACFIGRMICFEGMIFFLLIKCFIFFVTLCMNNKLFQMCI